MKIILSIILLAAATANAQLAVKFYGPANTQGLPEYWPQTVQPGTNAPAGFVLLTQAQLDTIISTNQAAYDSWESNKTYVAKVARDANLARIVALFEQIPAARTQMTNIKTSTISSVAAASTAIKTSANVIDGILEELQRLGPVLKELYRPESDNTQ